MRWVDHAAVRPHHCAVLPYISNSNAPGGFLDTGSNLNGPNGDHVYVSVVAIQEMARVIGWTPPMDRTDLESRVAELERECQRLRDENDDLNRDFEAIDVLASRGFTARKKAGRKSVNAQKEG